MSFPSKTIYLAGPITGLNYDDARNGWRKTFANILKAREANHIHCFSPMREKEFLEKDQCIEGTADYESLHGFGTPQGILTRDHNDVHNCDVMVANFTGAKKVSIGTCVEFGFAHSYRKPAIIIMEPATTITTERTVVREIVPAHVWVEGKNSIGKFLISQGHDIAGGEITGDVFDAENGGHVISFTVAGKKEIVRNPHDHVFLRACAGYVVPTLEHAADIAQSLLTPGL